MCFITRSDLKIFSDIIIELIRYFLIFIFCKCKKLRKEKRENFICEEPVLLLNLDSINSDSAYFFFKLKCEVFTIQSIYISFVDFCVRSMPTEFQTLNYLYFLLFIVLNYLLKFRKQYKNPILIPISKFNFNILKVFLL